MTSVGSNTTVTTPTGPTQPAPAETAPTLSEREQLKIEFYKTYDVMTGIRIAATLGGFFTLMVLLVVYKSRCKSNKQLEDPRLTAAAEAAVAEAEAEERALAAALEAIARLPPKPHRGPRRSLCAEVVDPRMCLVAPRFASVSGGYDSLLGAASGRSSCSGPAGGGGRRPQHHRRCSSATCSSTASSYLERRGSAMVMPCLPPPPKFPRHKAYDEPWDYYHPIDIQVIQPTPELSPCGSEAGLYGSQQQYQQPNQHNHHVYPSSATGRRAPLASMGSVDPPEPDSRSLGSDSVFLESCRAPAAPARDDRPPDTEDEVSGFSTDSSDGGGNRAPPSRQRPRRFLRVPPKRRRPPDRWDSCVGCVPRRRLPGFGASPLPPDYQTCMTISASIEAPRSPVLSTTTSSSQNSVAAVAAAAGLLSPPPLESPAIELRHRPGLTQKTPATPAALPLISSPPAWSQETLF